MKDRSVVILGEGDSLGGEIRGNELLRCGGQLLGSDVPVLEGASGERGQREGGDDKDSFHTLCF